MDLAPSEQLRIWAHELAGMAKTGLLHAHDGYDRDRWLPKVGCSVAAPGPAAAVFQ
ncbi:MAG: hypothetical protein ACYC9W_06675 [Candidatus Limnocylindria bacterium]